MNSFRLRQAETLIFQQTVNACRCALQLLVDNSADFLRRASIICLEDALLHPSLPVLVWLMCAHAKGYVLGTDAARACLHIMYQLASVRLRDAYPSSRHGTRVTGELNNLMHALISRHDPCCSALPVRLRLTVDCFDAAMGQQSMFCTPIRDDCCVRAA